MSHFSFIALVFLLCVTSSYAVKVADIGTICNKATNPSFCINLLKSKPDGATGDLVSLTQHIIDVVRTDIKNTINLITKLNRQSSDPKTKTHYKNCLLYFGSNVGALSEVSEIQQHLKSGDYNIVNMRAGNIMFYVDLCISGDAPGIPPFPDHSNLPKVAGVVIQVAQIILILSNFLLN
ncbi:pectinesterase inhibitor 1-like [Cicer arietinum]|uniref:Pectinesterase inhibitor 1-like n=1 Tax=Cicer arietinum TaxID=3827 RepID=A0A1S2Z8D1_CICAR|nr:pectinesterase inhibitor 1-like [Cicer arietinum]